jgi:RNA polymerase sigma-70 factor, ECF subfamily
MKKELENLVKQSDAALVHLAEEGNNDAFEALVMRHRKPIQKFLHALLHNNTLEKDVMQELWLNIFEQLHGHRYKEKGQFRQWLRTLAYRLAVSVKRTQTRRVSVEIAETIPVDSIDDEADNIAGERIRALHKSLTKLNERMRTIVKMRIEEELSFSEIANRLHTRTGSVTKIFSRAVKMLKKFLKK